MCQQKKYSIIYADPPWRFKNWSMDELAKRGEKWARRAGRSPYNVMDTQSIASLPIAPFADKNCVLFLWATYPKLEDALAVISGWGFEYKTVAFTWVKTTPNSLGYHFGLGYWTRANAEVCLLATRGKPHRARNDVPQLVVSDVMEHSHKPSIIRERIVGLMGNLPRIELFARRKVEGWDCWGNEVESDIEL